MALCLAMEVLENIKLSKSFLVKLYLRQMNVIL